MAEFAFRINRSTNFKRFFNGTFPINISDGSRTFMHFNFKFNETRRLNFSKWRIRKQQVLEKFGSFFVSGINLGTDETKTFYVDRVADLDWICIKDQEVTDISEVSGACNETNEYFVECNGQVSNGYLCRSIEDNTRFQITGLAHSAVVQQCQDNDGDGYGNQCLKGSDCDDSDASRSCNFDSSEKLLAVIILAMFVGFYFMKKKKVVKKKFS